ncbi:hypothetical protein JHK87_012325 [Glycine soja]|nr:hypothetical protein JHK87_012325 [Glycine soja]
MAQRNNQLGMLSDVSALSVHQLEALDRWGQHTHCAYELFNKDENRAIVIEELASVAPVLNLKPSVAASASASQTSMCIP